MTLVLIRRESRDTDTDQGQVEGDVSTSQGLVAVRKLGGGKEPQEGAVLPIIQRGRRVGRNQR